jgi:hypothetical protein
VGVYSRYGVASCDVQIYAESQKRSPLNWEKFEMKEPGITCESGTIGEGRETTSSAENGKGIRM